ncbi:MAG: zinc metalloprotease, partial [Cyclobacteriaceae bacterium]
GKRLDEIEAFIQKAQKNPEQYRLINGKIEIPVWVNVIYNQKKQAENISDAQIQSQIDVLNEDFNATNSDYDQVPTIFAGVKANVGIRFVLEGVTRLASKKTSWRTDNSCKMASKGGINPTSPTIYMNMWVCVLANNILGYAQFPGGKSSTDGVVIHTNAFGRGSYPLFSNFNLGRTATHEVGHWLSLRHIWGDATCGSDFVNDTPTHNTYNYGCPGAGHKSTCTGDPDEMWMNYMDYTNDACMYMFSAGQKARIDAAFFDAKGGRVSFAQP